MSFTLKNPVIGILLLICVLFAASFGAAAQTGDCLPTQFTEWGANAVVTPGDVNNVRAEPSTSGERIGQIAPGMVFNVVYREPVCAEGYLWRYIAGMAVEGWTVEANADTYFIEPYVLPEPETVASLPEDGSEFVVEAHGVRFVVPSLLAQTVGERSGIEQVITQPEIGIFALDSMGARPSALSFQFATNESIERGSITFYPYADALDYWYDGEWMETLFRDLPPLEQAMQDQRSGLPQMPISGVASLFDGAPAYVPFTNGNNLRYITYFAQDHVPFADDTVFSLQYRGITADRAFFVTGEFPIRIPASAVPPGGNEVRADDRYPAYLRALEANIAALPTSAFTPDLAAYDALMGSINITDNDALEAAIP